MSLWTERILSHFTADLTRLWVACDPTMCCSTKAIDRAARSGLRADAVRRPVCLSAEYEERYRAAWDRGERGQRLRWFCICAAPMRMRCRGTSCITVVWCDSALPICSPGWLYSAVQQVEPEHLAGLFHAHQTELQNARRRERVQGLHPRTRLPTGAEIDSQPGGLLARAAADALCQPLVATPVRPARGRHHPRQGAVWTCPSPHGWRQRARCCAWCRMRGIAT